MKKPNTPPEDIPLSASKKLRNRYLMVCHSGITQPDPKADPYKVGMEMMRRCLERIDRNDDPDLFPPGLLMLFLTRAFLSDGVPGMLLAGIQHECIRKGTKKVPLIGCSVATVAFDDAIHSDGALLVCWASRFLTAQVETADDLSDTAAAMKGLAKKLDLSDPEPNPYGNNSLIAFFPGRREDEARAAHLHRDLLAATQYSMPIFGGVSTVNKADEEPKWDQPAFQFDNMGVHRNAVVVARLEADFPIGADLQRGLKPTDDHYEVKSTESPLTLVFREKTVRDLNDLIGTSQDGTDRGFVMLGDQGGELREPDTAIIKYLPMEKPVYFRKVYVGERLTVLDADPEHIVLESRTALQRLGKQVEQPEAYLVFSCIGPYRYRRRIGIHEGTFPAFSNGDTTVPLVGCALDGEAGVNRFGQPILTSWATQRLLFGDELRAKSVARLGHKALARHVTNLAKLDSLSSACKEIVGTIKEAGFPGAMISLLVGPRERQMIVGSDHEGAAFARIKDSTRRYLDSSDLLAILVRGGKSRYIPDVQKDPDADQETARVSGLESLYVLPLVSALGVDLGVLMVDLGKIANREPADVTVEILQAMASVAAGTLARVVEFQTMRIHDALDSALEQAKNLPTFPDRIQVYLEHAAKAFEVDSAHVRQINDEGTGLEILAGIGDYYEAARSRRDLVPLSEPSRTVECYKKTKSIIVNDPSIDHGTLAAWGLHGDSAGLAQLSGSFVLTPLMRQNKCIGIISLTSLSPWHFHVHHERCLAKLSNDASTLARIQEPHEKATRLLGMVRSALKRFSEANDCASDRFSELITALKDAFGADIASLYLWDPDLSQLVLRAESGWRERGYVGRARYGEYDGWTGRLKDETHPVLVGSITETKSQSGLPPSRKYLRAMWGASADDNIIRYLGLPLWLGARMFGVLVFGIAAPEKDRRKFLSERTPTTTRVMDMVSRSVAGYVLQKEASSAERVHNSQRSALEQIIGELRSGDPGTALCRGMELFGCSVARLFQCGAAPSAEVGLSSMWPVEESGGPSVLVNAAFRLAERQLDRWPGEDSADGPPDPTLAEYVRSACMFSATHDGQKGVLEVQWCGDPPRHIRERFVAQIESVFQLAFPMFCQRQEAAAAAKLEADDRRNKDSLDVMDLVLGAAAHRFRNIIREVQAETEKLAKSDVRDALKFHADKGDSLVVKPLHFARDIERIKTRRVLLKSIITEVVKSYPDLGHRIKMADKPNCFAMVDRHITTEAFRNITDNAIRELREDPSAGLFISATYEAKGKWAVVEFRDTGRGMSPDQVRAMLDGGMKNQSKGGFGVLISRALVVRQGGRYRLESTERVGTTVTVELPLASEDKYETAGFGN